MFGRIVILLILTLAVLGCRNRFADDFLVPTSHPANPEASAAKPLRVSRALEPEFENVRPKLERKRSAPRQPAPTDSRAGHQHHQQ